MQCATLAGICLREMRRRTRIVTACVMLADLTTLSTDDNSDHSSAQTQYMGYCSRVRQTAQHPNTCRVDNRTPSSSSDL
ncbi:unnamed protein product [Macrosiphum euphorbiae]|uniref:Secreted protein n=1 Tax=Macrosiphum euphorbiae TaxID=13131 RepID=A0AAV0W6X3_9HEMI|nr:unnamed protein product [Macrosiphum euphorbiae]